MKKNEQPKMFNLTMLALKEELTDFNRVVELDHIKIKLNKTLKVNNKKEASVKI